MGDWLHAQQRAKDQAEDGGQPCLPFHGEERQMVPAEPREGGIAEHWKRFPVNACPKVPGFLFGHPWLVDRGRGDGDSAAGQGGGQGKETPWLPWLPSRVLPTCPLGWIKPKASWHWSLGNTACSSQSPKYRAEKGREGAWAPVPPTHATLSCPSSWIQCPMICIIFQGTCSRGPLGCASCGLAQWNEIPAVTGLHVLQAISPWMGFCLCSQNRLKWRSRSNHPADTQLWYRSHQLEEPVSFTTAHLKLVDLLPERVPWGHLAAPRQLLNRWQCLILYHQGKARGIVYLAGFQ